MTSISPWLSVPDGNAAVDFYTAAFGAVALERLEDDGDARFWLQVDDNSTPAALGGISVRMIVTGEDPDRMFKRAVTGLNQIHMNLSSKGQAVSTIA